MTNANEVLKAHADFFKAWPVKFAGPKPTADQLYSYHMLGARAGKQCLAGAMSLRDDGVTNSEIQVACGNPQLNKMRGFVDDALLKRVMVGKRNGRDIYKHVVTPKGLQLIARNEARVAKLEAAGQAQPVDKPAKVKVKKAKGNGAPKVKKATADKLPTVSPVEMPASEPTPVTDNADQTTT